MDKDTAWYVFRHYGHLMTKHERLANRHLAGTIRATLGHSDVDAQAEARSSSNHLLKLLLDDPQVLFLARDGYEAFALRTGQRIPDEHRDRIAFNCCPRCGALARTPKTRQCRFCGHDWHSEAGSHIAPRH